MRIITFKQAKPIWIKKSDDSWNEHIMLSVRVDKDGGDIIRIATHGFYQLFVNDKFVSYGPARAGRGYFRVDEINIKKELTLDNNKICLIVFSYGVDCYAQMNQEPFVTCEIVNKGNCVCYTGDDEFLLFRMRNYEQNVSRQSLQRGFAESYIINKNNTPVLSDYAICSSKRFVERNVEYPRYEKLQMQRFIAMGQIKREKQDVYEGMQAEENGPEFCMQYWPPKENITNELQELKYENIVQLTEDKAKTIDNGEFAVGEFAHETTGMINFCCQCSEDAEIFVTFDEMLSNNIVDPQRMRWNMAVKYKIEKGSYVFTTFEPVSLKYICFSVFGGKVKISDVKIIEYKHPPVKRTFNIENKSLQRIYDASLETFRQNAVDIYMDCPSRERAGWLCDSFFTARAEKFFTNESLIEKNFLENFLMEDTYKNIPDGMIPMCYPAEFRDGTYIPNWAMWLVAQLYEYYERTSDNELIERYREKIYKLYNFFKKYENKDGLLEKLDKWIFVDWSESNRHTQDVNFPSNMMYSLMLKRMSQLYNDNILENKSKQIKQKICELSYNGLFFCDNLLRNNDEYMKSGICTESCQYYAFFTGIATPESHPKLWNILINEFGPKRISEGLYKEIAPSNAFIGNFIRLELLARTAQWEKLLREIEGYFGYMAERTGTLWEKIDDKASLNHGFSSQIAVWIYQCTENLNNAGGII